MTDVIPSDYLDLFERPAFAHLAKLAREIPGQTRVPLSAARRSARALQSRTRKGQRDGMKPRNVQPYAKWTPF
jgi:hypothetical protein